MKILVCTLADKPYWPLARISVPNKAAYAARHGYDFLYYSRSWWPHYPTAMSKIGIINYNLQEYDWVFWTDADSIIMAPWIGLEYYIDPKMHLIGTSNQDGLNCGQLLIRSSAWSFGLLGTVTDSLPNYINHPHWEQAAINDFLGEGEPIQTTPAFGEFTADFRKPGELNRMVASGPQHGYKEMLDKFYDVWKPDDFILHFAGVGGERAPIRLQLMEHFIKLVEQ